MRLNELGHGRIEGPRLDPRDIVIRPGFNFRDTTSPEARAHIEWLKGSIRERGVQEAIRVEFDGEKAYLVNGECRVIACLELFKEGFKVKYQDGSWGPPTLPSVVVKGDEAEVLATSITANGSLPPSQLEFGAAVARLVSYGWSIERASEYTPPHIAKNHRAAVQYTRDALELHQAPQAVKEIVRSGVEGAKVSPALAVQTVRKDRAHAAEKLQEAAKTARSKGQAVAKRPKGEGKATRTRQNEAQALTTGDRLAILVLSEHPDWEEMTKVARRYVKLRKE